MKINCRDSCFPSLLRHSATKSLPSLDNGERVTTLDGLRTALKALPAGSAVVLQVQRDQRLQFLAFTLD